MKKCLVVILATIMALWITSGNTYAQDSKSASICIGVYNDLDGMGTFNYGEELVAGAFIQIYDSTNHKVAWYTTDGVNDPLCTQVVPGLYYITVKVPEGFKATTKNEFEIQVADGSQVALDFGVQPKVGPPDNASLANTNADNTNRDSFFTAAIFLTMMCESLCVGAVFGGAVVWGLGRIRRRSTLPPA